MLGKSLTNWWESSWSQVETIASYVLPTEMKSIASSVLPGNLIANSPFPLHVCQQKRCWIISRALTTSGLENVAMELYKIKEKTLVRFETDQGRLILTGVQAFVSLVRRMVSLPDIPIKTETSGSKTIITLELKEGIFCDCAVKTYPEPPLESEEDEPLEREEDEPLEREEDEPLESEEDEPLESEEDEPLESEEDEPRMQILPLNPANEVEASQESKTMLIKEFLELTDAEESFLEEEPPADEVEADRDAGTVLKEFFELSDLEETFLERQSSIRRSVRSLAHSRKPIWV